MLKQSKTKYLDILQIFRGIAALMVVFHHTIGSLKYYHKIDNGFLSSIGFIGKFGVDFFFVLSGFIISYAAYNKYKDNNALKDYLKNRLLRVYVPYLPIGILMYLFYTLFPHFSNGEREISLLTSFTLFPQGNPALSVAWTLTFELCFYLLFSISFFSKKAWNYFAILWFILILIANYSAFNTIDLLKTPIFRILLSTYNIEFLLGYLLSLLIIKGIKLSFNQFVLLLILSFSGCFYYLFNCAKLEGFYINLLFAVSIFIVLYTFIVYFNKSINRNSILMYVGNASYSIYLIHNPLQMVVVRCYPQINSILNLTVLLAAVFLLTIGIGYLYYFLFEKKLMDILKSKLISS